MTALPPELQYGHVVGRVILAVADTGDADTFPDAVPAQGTVTFTPKNPEVRVGEPDPVVVLKQKIVCTIDAAGYVTDPDGKRGVWLVTGVYTVSYSFTAASLPAHDIVVSEGHTLASPLDLTLALPPGGPVLQPSQYAELTARIDSLGTGGGGDGTPGADGASAYEVAVAAGFEGTEAEWLASLVGPAGAAGGPAETLITTATYTVTEPGDYIAQTTTTVTLPDGSTRSLTPGQYVCVRLLGAAWYISTVGTLEQAVDETPPTAGTLTVSTAGTTADLLVSGALDDIGLHEQPYRYSRDNGATWTAWQGAASYAYAGLTQSTSYTFVHEVRDAAGNVKRGAAVTASTSSALTWTTLYADGPTKPDGTVMATGLALDTTQGGRTWTKVSSLAPTAQGGWWTGPAGGSTMFRVENAPTPGGYLYRMSAQYDISGAVRSSVGVAFELGTGSHGVAVNPLQTDATRFQVTKPPKDAFTVVEVVPVPASVPLTGTIAVEWNAGTRTIDAYLNGVRHFTATRNAGPAAATTANLTMNVSWGGAKARDIKVEVYS